jgi:hypothetical protein
LDAQKKIFKDKKAKFLEQREKAYEKIRRKHMNENEML